MICDDCNKVMKHYQSTSLMSDVEGFQTKRYFKCTRCGTVKIEVLENLIEVNTDPKIIDVLVIKPRTAKQTTLFQ